MSSALAPRLVVFDLYGTLIKFGIMHHPFRELLKWARAKGRRVNENDARQLMTIDKDLPELAADLGIHVPQILLDALMRNIQEELASLSLFDDVISTLDKLQKLGTPVAICSNLARPYGIVIDRLLSQYQLHCFLSYEVGFIKPEPEMYQKIITSLNVPANQCLFIGDTLIADYEGPINNGFQARHLIRGQNTNSSHTLTNLQDVFALF